LRDAFFVEIGCYRSVGRRVEGGTKAGMESDGMGRVEGNGGGIDPGLLLPDDTLDFLVKLVGYASQ